MTDKEVLKQALEYLRDNQHYIADNERHAYVMEYNAFVERLEALMSVPDKAQSRSDEEQPAHKQEPVVRWDSDGWGDLLVDSLPDGTLLYTSPPASKPLTDEQIDAAIKAWFETGIVAGRQPFAKRIRAAIEAAHGIKE